MLAETCWELFVKYAALVFLILLHIIIYNMKLIYAQRNYNYITSFFKYLV